MKTYYAVEICRDDEHFPEIYYRSDLYPTREQAIDAFLNLRTMELFQAMAECLNTPYSPINLRGEYEDADALRMAYYKGTQEVNLMIEKFQTMARNTNKSFKFDDCYLELDVKTFTAHD